MHWNLIRVLTLLKEKEKMDYSLEQSQYKGGNPECNNRKTSCIDLLDEFIHSQYADKSSDMFQHKAFLIACVTAVSSLFINYTSDRAAVNHSCQTWCHTPFLDHQITHQKQALSENEHWWFLVWPISFPPTWRGLWPIVQLTTKGFTSGELSYHVVHLRASCIG